MYSCTSLIHIQQCSFKHIISLQKRIEWKRFAFVHFYMNSGVYISRNVRLFMKEKHLHIHQCQDVKYNKTIMSKTIRTSKDFSLSSKDIFSFCTPHKFIEFENRKSKVMDIFDIFLILHIDCVLLTS